MCPVDAKFVVDAVSSAGGYFAQAIAGPLNIFLRQLDPETSNRTGSFFSFHAPVSEGAGNAMKKQQSNRLLTTCALVATITLALGIDISPAAAASKGRGATVTSVSKPGTTAFSGEPDSGGSQLPAPPKVGSVKLRPAGGSSPLRTWLWFGIWNLYLRR